MPVVSKEEWREMSRRAALADELNRDITTASQQFVDEVVVKFNLDRVICEEFCQSMLRALKSDEGAYREVCALSAAVT